MSSHELIRRARKAKQWTEQDLADRVGVSRSAVQQWERPGGTAPSRKHQATVARLFGISVGELMTGQSDLYPPQQQQAVNIASDTDPDQKAIESGQRLTQVMHLFAALDEQRQHMAISYLKFLADPAENGAAPHGHHLDVPDGKKAA